MILRTQENVKIILLQIGCGYGAYQGLNGARTLINLKEKAKELDNEGEMMPFDYKYYKGLSSF